MTTHTNDTRWQVEPYVPADEAYAVLATDRIWNGYSIADLEPPFGEYAQVVLARQGMAAPAAASLILRHPAFTSLIPYGDATAFEAILQVVALPSKTFFLAQEPHLALLEQFYDFGASHIEMVRMFVGASTFRPPRSPQPEIGRLGPEDVPDLQELYSAYGANAFTPDQVLHGVFYGVRTGGLLVAAGGTHVLSQRYSIAAVGNIYTRPAARGRGYGSGITGAVVAELLRNGYRDIILNVAVMNEAAHNIYLRLGFAPHCRYWEGHATRRTLPVAQQ